MLAGEATATPKTRSGVVEAIRVLRVARSGAVKARTQAANQLRDLLVTAPEPLRAELYQLSTAKRVRRLVAQQPAGGAAPALGSRPPASCWSPPGTALTGCTPRRRWRRCAAPARWRRPRVRPFATG